MPLDIGVVGWNRITSGGPTVTVTFSPTTGCPISGMVRYLQETNATLSTVTDDQGNAYTILGGSDTIDANGVRSRRFRSTSNTPTVSGALTITATYVGGATNNVEGDSFNLVWDVTGGGQYDASNGQAQVIPSGGGGTDFCSTGSLGTPSANDGLVVGAFSHDIEFATHAVGTGYTLEQERTSPPVYLVERLLQTTATAATATMTTDQDGRMLNHGFLYVPSAVGPEAKSGSDSGTGTEGTPAVGLSGPKETGTGTENGSCSGTVTGLPDTGTGTDRTALIALSGPADSGTGTETAALVVVQTGSDTGTFTDNLTEIEISTGGESGTGTDTGSVSATAGPGESGSGVENGSVSATLTASDTGTGTDAATVVQTGTNPADSDSGNGSDAAVVEAFLASLDSGTGVDAASVVVTLVGAETGTGTDTGWLSSVEWTVSDSGTGVEASSVLGPTTYSGLALGKPYIVPRLGGEYP